MVRDGPGKAGPKGGGKDVVNGTGNPPAGKGGCKGGGKTAATEDDAGEEGFKGTGKAAGKASAGKDGAAKGGFKGTGKAPAAGKDAATQGGPKGTGKAPAAGKDGATKGGPKGTGKAPAAGKDGAAKGGPKGTGKAPAAGKDGADGVGLKGGPKGTGKSPAAGKDGVGKGGLKGTGKSPAAGKDGGNRPGQSTTAPATGETGEALHTPPPRTAIENSPNTGTPPTKPAETNGTVVAPNKPTNPGPKGAGCKGGNKGTTTTAANASSSDEGAKGKIPTSKGKGKGHPSAKVGWDQADHSVRRRVSFDGLVDPSYVRIPALSGPNDIPLQQRKALNERLRRRMTSGQGLRKGLVNQWAATPAGSMARFEFLKAFLLDKDLSTIVVEPYYEERLSESKEKETFEELPLCLIKERYKNVEGGDKFVEDLQKSQTGKKHPQTDCPNWRIYKIFKSISTTSALGKIIRSTMCVY
ncbi:unnamed protein product [Symbiodinium sp. CCMP2592]|nr:unnamed protein product [Symbiodinium sp. CCMP2592]